MKHYTIEVHYDYGINRAFDGRIVAAVGQPPVGSGCFAEYPYRRDLVFECDQDGLRDIEDRLAGLQNAGFPIFVEYTLDR